MTPQARYLSAIFVCALSCAACNEKRSERVAASYSTAAKSQSAAPSVREPPRAPSDTTSIPVEEDYEARAATSIDANNLASKLTELEHEMSL